MAEELRPETPFGIQVAHENIWHIAASQRWSDGQLIGHHTYCGRNYPLPATAETAGRHGPRRARSPGLRTLEAR